MPGPARIQLADDFTLPIDIATSTTAFLGVRGSGKTNAATVVCEGLLDHHVPVAIYDPIGAHWGLRSSADGKSPGYPVVIFGGAHADLPLEPGSGRTIAEVIVAERIPAILDVSQLRKGQRTTWATEFFETLYEKNTLPLHVCIDEAHTVAPQRLSPDIARLLGAIEDIVLQGRIKGLGVSMATQRPALLNKNCLSMAETLIVLRTTGKPDAAAIDDWINHQADPELGRRVKATLRELATGQAWVWSPHFLHVMTQVQIRKRSTFDSSATPKIGESRITPETWANIDIASLGDRIHSTVDDTAHVNDPKMLRRRVDELSRELTDAQRQLAEQRQRIQQQDDELRELRERPPVTVEVPAPIPAPLADAIARIAPALETALDHTRTAAQLLDAAPIPAGKPAAKPAASKPATTRPAFSSGNTPLPKVERAALTVLAQHHPAPRSATQIALTTGYSPKGGGFLNGLGALRSKGYITGTNKAMTITPAGLVELGDYTRLPTGPALLDHWCSSKTLGRAEAAALRTITAAYPDTLSAGDVAATTGYSPTGGGFLNALGKLRRLELITGANNAMQAAPELID